MTRTPETNDRAAHTNDAAPSLRTFRDPEATAHAAASRFAEIACLSSNDSGRFSVALSGGSTPKRIYELLSEEPLRAQVPWDDVHIFFGDERAVPPDHAESNYRMASESLLSRVPVPTENIHRIRGEGDAVANASLYEDELRVFFPGAQWPAFDLVMLGLGGDGHTASLFPGADVLGEREAWVAATWVEHLGAYRITLTAGAINHARNLLFVVTGKGKADALREVIEGERDPSRLPAQLITPTNGALEWFVDEAAASRLRAGASAQ
ncbi:MAG TPA: 6-phosphogluconolactonase [Pyrinomonadaceae bacterium]|nr:6-phosphogluconolactonase [Pyrinomonadaceae bacterium]